MPVLGYFSEPWMKKTTGDAMMFSDRLFLARFEKTVCHKNHRCSPETTLYVTEH